MSVIEIYNEMIRDLLGDDPTAKLEVKQGKEGLYVPGLTEIQVKNVQELNEVRIILEYFGQRAVLTYSRLSSGKRKLAK